MGTSEEGEEAKAGEDTGDVEGEWGFSHLYLFINSPEDP